MAITERLSLKESPFRKGEVFVGVVKDNGEERLEYMNAEDFRLHTSILGATGAGKTQLLTSLLVQFIWNDWPILMVDMKFDPGMFRAAWAAACICGRQKDFKLLSPLAVMSESGMLGEFGTCTYNPLLGITNPIAATAAILNSAESEKKGAGDPFWSGVKTEIVDTLVRAFISTGKSYSFKDMWIALERSDALSSLISQSRDEEANIVMCDWLSKLRDPDQRTQSMQKQYMQGAKMFFRGLGTGALGKMLNSYEPDISLKSAYLNNQIIWSVLPSLQIDNTAKSLGKLILSELRFMTGEIQATTESRKPFLVVIDEFEGFIFNGLTDLFDKGRGAGLSLVVAHQNPEQIDLETSKEMRHVIYGNTNNKFFMRTNSADTAKDAAELIGKDDAALSLNYDGFGIREAEQYLIPPRYFTEMDDFSCVIRRKGVTRKGHVISFPTNWKLGEQVPRPYFAPSLSRENGVRLWEKVKDRK